MKQESMNVELWQSTEKVKSASLPLFMGFGLATGVFGGALIDGLFNFTAGGGIVTATAASVVGLAMGFVAQRRERVRKVKSQVFEAAYAGYLQLASKNVSEHKPTYSLLKSNIYKKESVPFGGFYQIDFECKANDINHKVSVEYKDREISTSITINELDNLETMFNSAVLFTGKTPQELAEDIREKHLMDAKKDILVENLETVRNECYYSPESLLEFADEEASAISVTGDWKVITEDYESGYSDLYTGYVPSFWNYHPYQQVQHHYR